MAHPTGSSPLSYNDGSHGSEEDKGEAIAVAILAFFLGIIGALIGWLITKDSDSLYLRRHGSTTLRCILSYTLYIFILIALIAMIVGGAEALGSASIVLFALIPGIALAALAVANFVFSVILIVKASDVELYRPPGTIGKA